jgi:hypothetical protein
MRNLENIFVRRERLSASKTGIAAAQKFFKHNNNKLISVD